MGHFEGQELSVLTGTPGGAYAAGDIVGGLVKLASIVPDSHGSLKLISLAVTDTAKQAKGFNIFFFDTAVTIGADNTPFDVSAADALHCLGFFTVLDADHVNSVSRSFASKANIQLLMQVAKAISNNTSAVDLWCVVVTTGAPTYTANCLQFKLGLEKQR